MSVDFNSKPSTEPGLGESETPMFAGVPSWERNRKRRSFGGGKSRTVAAEPVAPRNAADVAPDDAAFAAAPAYTTRTVKKSGGVAGSDIARVTRRNRLSGDRAGLAAAEAATLAVTFPRRDPGEHRGVGFTEAGLGCRHGIEINGHCLIPPDEICRRSKRRGRVPVPFAKVQAEPSVRAVAQGGEINVRDIVLDYRPVPEP